MNSQPKHLKTFWTRKNILIVSLITILGITVGAVAAWLSGHDGDVTFSLEGAQVSCQMVNSYNNAAVQNTDEVSAHIRVAVLVNYRKQLGNGQYGTLFPNPPDPEDYAISYNLNDWVKGQDDYYYYKYPLAPGATTAQLVTGFSVNRGTPAGYELRVEYICEAIQSDPAGQPATQAWGATVNSNNHITGASGITWD